MTTLRETVQSVLDRWDSPLSEYAASDLFEELRAALEQPEQGVAMTDRKAMEMALEALESLFNWQVDHERGKRCGDAVATLRAALEQPKREPLTDADIKLVMNGRGEEGDDAYIKPAFDPYGISEDDLLGFARAIEQAHGIGEKP